MHANIQPHIISKCGRRENNEDVERYRMNLHPDGFIVNPKYAPGDFFLICDGHGGDAVAKYVAPVLEKFLMEKSKRYPLKVEYINAVYNYIQKSLKNHPENISKHCGCTALAVIIYFDNNNKRFAQIINSGDCRAIMSKDGLANPLSIDHKPSWPDEKQRIDRVNKIYATKKKVTFIDHDFRIGDLSVSRSFGDLDNTPHVTHIPEIYNYEIDETVEFIVMACDGVWDVLRNEEVVNFVRDHKNENHIDLYNIPHIYPFEKLINPYNIAEKLANYAIARGSTDNISIIIIFFDKWSLF